MSDRIDTFIKGLEAQLKDIPQKEREEAINYYREYLMDACDAGKDEDSVIKQLGSVEQIAGEIRMEASIIRARNHPGLRSYGSFLKSSFRFVSTPLQVFMLSLLVLFSGSIFITFFAGAFSFFLATILVLFGMIYEATRMPAHFYMEIIGTLGMGLMLAGILLYIAFLLNRLGILFIRLSVWMIAKMHQKPGRSESASKNAVKGKQRTKIISWACLAAFVAGLALFAVSGLPMRYFTIFNSNRPTNTQVEAFKYDINTVQAISVVTAHSVVQIEKSADNQIEMIYEKPDWLDYVLKLEEGRLAFEEKSNGRLPLFQLVSLHESLTTVILRVPEGFHPQLITVESIGGHFFLNDVVANVRVKTQNGRIELDMEKEEDVYVAARTANGNIYDGALKNIGKTFESKVNKASVEKAMDFETVNGDIIFFPE